MNFFWRLFPWLLLTVVLIAFAVRKITWWTRDQPATPNYALVLDSLYNQKFEPVDSGDIVLVGDSKTQMFAVAEYFPGVKIKNRGIPSNTIPMIIRRLPSITRCKPAVIIIEAGINDIFNGRTLPEITQDYRDMIHLIRQQSPSTHIYLATLAPVYNHKDSAKFNEGVAKVNTLITSVTMFPEINTQAYTALAHIHKIRLGARITRDMVTDDVHLNAAGYRVWAEQYKQAINEQKEK